MIALVLAGILFLQTPMGVAAVEIVKESVSRLIEILFPPKDIIVMPEGTPEVVHHEAQGRDPEEDTPGFAMHVDTESYVMTEKNGIYYVRQIPIEYDREEIRKQQAALLEGLSSEEQEAAIDARIQELKDFYAALPANEIEIREVPNKEFSAYAEEVRNQMFANWEITEDMIVEASKKKIVDSNGMATYVVDEDVKAYIISELTMVIMMKYDPTRISRKRKNMNVTLELHILNSDCSLILSHYLRSVLKIIRQKNSGT